MPFKSRAQQGYMNAHKKEIGAKVVNEFNAASKGKTKDLPQHVKSSSPKKGGK